MPILDCDLSARVVLHSFTIQHGHLIYFLIIWTLKTCHYPHIRAHLRIILYVRASSKIMHTHALDCVYYCSKWINRTRFLEYQVRVYTFYIQKFRANSPEDTHWWLLTFISRTLRGLTIRAHWAKFWFQWKTAAGSLWLVIWNVDDTSKNVALNYDNDGFQVAPLV